MAVNELQDRTDRLFGRKVDLDWLRARAGQTGLTAVVGLPQIGKSWLLMELARTLAEHTDPPCLVGYLGSPRGAPDPLLQVLSDLYQRWLAEAGTWQQIKTTWEQQKDQLLPNFAKFVGKLSEKAAENVPALGKMFGAAVKESLEGLVAASEDLRTGRLIVSRLEYSQAQELVRSVRQIAKRRIVLLMDQWDESRGLDLQANLLREVVREPDQWSGCHIFLGTKEGSEAAALLHRLCREYPEGADIYKLREMDVAAAAEGRPLVDFLRPHVKQDSRCQDGR